MIYEPRLYIVARSDLWHNNPGKMMAQAAHAQALFDLYDKGDFLQEYAEWRGDGPDCIGFGPTIVLKATWEEMCDIEENIAHTGMVVDPTYPWQNWYGETFHSAETTCMWAFVWKETEFDYMKKYPLHP